MDSTLINECGDHLKMNNNIDKELNDISAGIEKTKLESVTMDKEDPHRKRGDYLEWPEYFMAIAFLSAQRSKDPKTQVGACIVNEEKKIVGIGYNGMPNGCDDDLMPWGRESDDELNNKYLYVCHAELNAILNKNSADVKNCSVYVALFPCNECAKVIIQSGIKEVIYYSIKNMSDPSNVAARRMFDLAGVKYRQFQPSMRQVIIDFDVIEKSIKQSPSEENPGK